MSREIKFRGRRLDNLEWVYGYLVVDPEGGYRIYWKPFDEATSNTYHFVIPETVGQFTSLPDKNRSEIYEGDIMYQRYFDKLEESGYGETFLQIAFKDGAFGWIGDITGQFFSFAEQPLDDYEIIGNIYEHPHLLTPSPTKQ